MRVLVLSRIDLPLCESITAIMPAAEMVEIAVCKL